MSEFSGSCHIRTNDSGATERQLLTAGYAGMVFGPKNGWLTFVPFAEGPEAFEALDPAGLSPKLSEVTDSLVLQYCYGEDHMWGFSVAKPGKPLSLFVASWDPEPEVWRDQLDLSALDGIVPPAEVEPFLQGQDGISSQPHAYGFAELLGLPSFRSLSPLYLEIDTSPYLEVGGRIVGEASMSMEQQLGFPSPTTVEITVTDFSAREALQMLTPQMGWMGSDWILTAANGNAHAGSNDSLPTTLDSWTLNYLNQATKDQIEAYIFANGNCGFRAVEKLPENIPETLTPQVIDRQIQRLNSLGDGFDGFHVANQIRNLEQVKLLGDRPYRPALPDDWLDSNRIADIVSKTDVPSEMPKAEITNLSLSWDFWPQARWTVTCLSNSNDAHDWHWTIELDALTGDVLYQSLSGSPENDYTHRTERARIGNGDWHDVD